LILEQGQKSGVSARTLRKDWAALYLMAGDVSRARTTLQAMADEPGADPMTVAMLAMVMIEQGEYAAVESKILPRLAKMENTADNYFVHVIQGRIYQMKGKKWFSEARKRFQRAFIIRPDVSALREVIFRLDVALGDRRAAEAHAIEILRVNASHPLANFFMGSVALEEGDYGRGEEYLKRAAEAPQPTVEALNNYAQLLCRIRRTDEAVKVARKATQVAPDRYEVWSTLAYILQDTGKLKEASQALIKASTLNKTDKRLFIIDGLIALKRGDLVSVKRAVDAVSNEAGNLPVTSRRDLQKLKDALMESR
jgi:tetratricopeptide (TPR) repeat protein